VTALSPVLGTSIVGWLVRECCVGFRVELVVTADNGSAAARGVVVLSGTATVSVGALSWEIDVEGAKQELAPLLGAVGGRIGSSTVREDGTLAIGLDNGWRINVPPDPRFEAWEMRTPTEQLVCQPGGEVSAW
jgi:hypothetical protein